MTRRHRKNKRYFLFAAIMVVIGLFLVTRSVDISLHNKRVNILLQLKGLDALLDRDVMQVSSFLLNQYDPLVQTTSKIRILSKTLRDPKQEFYTHTEPNVDQAIDNYISSLEQKMALLEHIKYQASLVRNGLHYLPVVVEELHQIIGQHGDKTIELLNKLYQYNIFPSELERQQILQQIEALTATINDTQLGAVQALLTSSLFHMRANLKGFTALADLKSLYIATPTTEHFEKLNSAYGAYHSSSVQRSEWFSIGLLFTTILLLTLLRQLLTRLDSALDAAESAWNRLRDAVESISEAFALFDTSGKLVLHNRKWLEFYPWLKGLLQTGSSLDGVREANANHITHEKSEEKTSLDSNTDTNNYLEQLDDGHWFMASDNPTGDGGLACVRVDITEAKQTEFNLRKMERALEQSPASVVITNTEGVIEYVNPKFVQISGYSAEEAIGKNPRVLKSDEKSSDDYKDLWETITAGHEWKGYFHNKHKDGTIYWEAATISPLRSDDGTITHYIAVKEDITDRKRAEDQLRMNATVFDTTTEGIMITDVNNRIKTINPAFTRITGYKAEDVIGSNPSILASGRHDDAFYYDMWNHVEKHGFWSGEIWNRHKNGRIYPEWLSIAAIRDKKTSDSTEYVAVFSDISQRKQDEEQIRHQANYDALTGLPNRSLFFDRLSQAALPSRREKKKLAMLFIDLDRFKSVNDSYGHIAGDEILLEVGGRLNTCIRNSDTVARLGGDEFVVLLHDLGEVNDAAIVADKIIDQMSLPFNVGRRDFILGASIGITIYPDDTNDPEEMMRNADMAMYRAKEEGRNRYQFFTVGMQEHVRERLELEQDLRVAIDQNQLQLHYQPIVDAKTEKISSVEALCRWMHPKHGLVPPETFIPLAEDTGLITTIGEWVLREACRKVSQWQDSGINIGISVNVSSRQHSKEFNPWITASIMKEYGVSSKWLTLEITETLLMDDNTEVIEWLNGFKELGISLSIDDFGTGYSSLSYLRKFPVDVLKIDRSFVQELPDNQDNVSLVEAILAMGNSLGLTIVAEGVETEQQHDFLQARDCKYLQGYLFSKPMPEKQLMEWMDERGDTSQESG